MQDAQNLPEEQREVVARNAMLILLSERDDCSIAEESEEFNSVSEDEMEEEMEEEMDEDTDLIFDSLSEEGSTSLLQKGQWPSEIIMPITGALFGSNLGTWIGLFILMILWGILCGFLMEMIRRALRWMRCSISGGDEKCFGAPPAAWFRHVVKGGCAVIGALMGVEDMFRSWD